MRADGGGIVAVAALERADRRVLRIRPRWDDVEHRSEVEIDARARELAAPQRCARPKGRGIDRALIERARDRAEARPGERLDDAALLIRRDKAADACRRAPGREPLHRIGDGAYGRRARGAPRDEHDGAKLM